MMVREAFAKVISSLIVLGVAAFTDPPPHLTEAATGAVLMGQDFRLPVVASTDMDRAPNGKSGAAPKIIDPTSPRTGVFGVSEGELGDNSDVRWTFLNTNWEEWPLCRKGVRQSPVDLVRPYWAAYLKLEPNYQDQLWPIQVNDGRTVYVDFDQNDESVLKVGDKEMTPVRASFHSPSMHKLNGTEYDMEMQILHKDSDGNQVGVAVMMQIAEPNPADFYVQNVIAHFFQGMPKAGTKRRTESFNLKTIINDKMAAHYVSYPGSLTNPPCTEGVQWFVLGRAWSVPEAWVKGFKHVVPQPNIRPLQEVGDREIESF